MPLPSPIKISIKKRQVVCWSYNGFYFKNVLPLFKPYVDLDKHSKHVNSTLQTLTIYC